MSSFADPQTGLPVTRAFIWDDGAAVDITALLPGTPAAGEFAMPGGEQAQYQRRAGCKGNARAEKQPKTACSRENGTSIPQKGLSPGILSRKETMHAQKSKRPDGFLRSSIRIPFFCLTQQRPSVHSLCLCLVRVQGLFGPFQCCLLLLHKDTGCLRGAHVQSGLWRTV